MPSPNIPTPERRLSILLLTAAVYIVAHRQATVWRGYDAAGGELLIWLLPLLWRLTRRCAHDWIREIKELYETDE